MSIAVTSSHSFLATDEPVGIVHTQSEYTVAQAAELLDMSEGCVDELLKIGVLIFSQDSDRRFIQRNRLLEYDRDRKFRHAGLLEIIRMDEEMGLYDD